MINYFPFIKDCPFTLLIFTSLIDAHPGVPKTCFELKTTTCIHVFSTKNTGSSILVFLIKKRFWEIGPSLS